MEDEGLGVLEAEITESDEVEGDIEEVDAELEDAGDEAPEEVALEPTEKARQLFASYLEPSEEEAKAEFEHVLETFKILD